MDTLEAIYSRRSVRQYTDQPVTPEHLDSLLKAAMSAPSAHNEAPWHFLIITDRAKLDAIPDIHPYSKMLLQAPLAVIICADLNLQKDPSVDYWVQDCAAAAENMLLTAHALGLGACWLGIHPRTDRVAALQQMFSLPSNIVPFCLVALGHPRESKPRKPRYRPERVHHEKW